MAMSSLLLMASIALGTPAKDNIECRAIWASGVKSQSACRFEILSTEGPSLLQISNPLSLTKADLLDLEFEIDHVENLKGFEIRRIDPKTPEIYQRFTLDLYADTNFGLLKSGERQRLLLSLSHLQNSSGPPPKDPSLTQIYLETKSGLPVALQLKSQKRTAKAFPTNGRTSITFDDGFSSTFKAGEIMRKANLSGTAYLIHSAAQKPHYLTRSQICKLGGWGWALSTHHETPYTEIPNLKDTVTKDQEWLQGLCPRGAKARHLAYPLGLHNQDIQRAIENNFDSARMASGGLETLPPARPLALRTVNVTPLLKADDLLKMALAAHENGNWLILMFHRLSESPQSDLEYPFKEFKKLIQGLEKSKVTISTVPEVLDSIKP